MSGTQYMPNPSEDPSPDVAETIFHAARAVPPEQRDGLIADRCVGNPALQERVLRLLRASDQAGDFLAPHAGPTLDPALVTTGTDRERSGLVGTRVGRYRLLQLIGEGGFGTVYLAEQTDPVRRKVALKIIKPGMDTGQVVARFEAERQALALMDHPHIARVFDGGTTGAGDGAARDFGRPYFVMEYVVGDPITAFADTNTLSLRERLELFEQVCSAVQHAHTKGIIHRDLKPANVLVSMVDGKPFAKVIDFGIAKATAQPLTDRTLFTEHRVLMGTPEYMSPEQTEGSPDIDTRTDVYALGVLLYELLTGSTPIESKRLRSAAFDEMRRMIREDDPPAPSARLSRTQERLGTAATARSATPARLSALVRGELDWIVLKALEKDRSRRYDGAGSFGEDVRRHLTGEPVRAAPPSVRYRVTKFIRRNKTVALLAAVVLAGSIGTGAFAIVAAQNARRANQNAIEAFAALEKADWAAYTANIALAQAAVGSSDFAEARRILDRTPERIRGWEYRLLETMSRGITFISPRGVWLEAAFADTEPLIVSGDPGQRTLGLWDARTGNRLPFAPELPDDPTHAAFAPGARYVLAFVTGSQAAEEAIYVIDRSTGHVRPTPERIGGGIARAWFPPESGLVPLRGPWITDVVWDTAAARTRPLAITRGGEPGGGPDSTPRYAPMSSAGGRVVAYRDADTLDVIDAATGHITRTLKIDRRDLRDMAISPDGTKLAIHGESRTFVYDLVGGGEVSTPGLPSLTRVLEFSRDGAFILSAETLTGQTSVWEVATGAERPDLVGLIAPARAGTFSADGRLAAVSILHDDSRDFSLGIIDLNFIPGDTNIWMTEAALVAESILERSPGASGLTLDTPDGARRIVADNAGSVGVVRFLDLTRRVSGSPVAAAGDTDAVREVAAFRLDKPIERFQMTGDGATLIVRLADGQARVWDIRDSDARRADLRALHEQHRAAGPYVDALLNDERFIGDPPPSPFGNSPESVLQDMLTDTIRADTSRSALQRLAALSIIADRLSQDAAAAERALRTIKSELGPLATDRSTLLAAARRLEAPPRIRSRVERLITRLPTPEQAPATAPGQ